MSKKKKALNLKSWRDFAKFWSQVKVPWRPTLYTQKQVEKYAKQISKKIKNPKALICGSTVEFRDILAKYKFDVTCLDINSVTYRAFGSLMKRKPFKEKLVFDNWLAAPFKKNCFDLVLGDYLPSNIKYNEQDKLFKNISVYVKKDGIVIQTVALYKLPGIKIRKMVEKYKKDPKYFNNFTNKWYWIAQCHKESGVYDKRICSYKWHIFDKKLYEFVKTGEIKETDYKKLRTGIGVFVDCFPPKRMIEKKLRKYFKIISIGNKGIHPIMDYLYTFILKPKK